MNIDNLDLLQMYEEGIENGKDKTFAVYQRVDGRRENYTYDFVVKESNKLIEKLEKAGLKKGDRVGVISALRPMWFALHYACLKNGYIMVCIDPGVPATQMQKMLLQTEVRVVFTTLKTIYLPVELDKHIPVYSIDKGFPLISTCQKIDRVLLGESSKLPVNTFYILFSSGTTSENRKAVLLDHKTITLAISYALHTDTGVYRNRPCYERNEKSLMLFPPYHVAGLLCLSYNFWLNTKTIILERLTPNALVSVLQEMKPDNICTVPSMLTSLYKKVVSGYSSKPLNKLLVNKTLAVSGFLRKNFGIKVKGILISKLNKQAFGGNLKNFMIGASPIDTKTNEFFLNMGIDVIMAYGLTELGAPLATTGLGYYPGTAGRVVRHTDQIDIRIVNPDESGRGEVEVLSPFRMISYLYKKDNVGCFTDDGYFKTGDLGYFDKNKCLNICGRIKESIVLKNGEKLLPEEIEEKYQNLDCIQDVVAFKIPGKGGCDDFAIAITKQKEKGIPDEASKDRVFERASHLPQMYRPNGVYIVKELPLSSSHKVQRFRLTEMVVKGNDSPITDASMIPIDNDQTTTELRKILIEVGGDEWKTKELTQGLLLNLDSLSTVDLYVAIQEKWDIDLFQTTTQPETFGELLDVIKNFDVVDKNLKAELDLSQYPLPVSKINRFTINRLERFAKQVWHVRGYGQTNIPTDTNYLLCSNHRTPLDPAFICSCLSREINKNTCIVGKAELVNDKLLKGFVLNHNFIPIDRTGNSIQTLDRSRELLEEGWNILIFPEGTNVENNTKMYPLKDGAAKLAIATNKPIVPVHITGVAEVKKEMGTALDMPPLNSRIRIKFGKPIYPENMDVKELNELLRQKIEELN